MHASEGLGKARTRLAESKACGRVPHGPQVDLVMPAVGGIRCHYACDAGEDVQGGQEGQNCATMVMEEAD